MPVRSAGGDASRVRASRNSASIGLCRLPDRDVLRGLEVNPFGVRLAGSCSIGGGASHDGNATSFRTLHARDLQ